MVNLDKERLVGGVEVGVDVTGVTVDVGNGKVVDVTGVTDNDVGNINVVGGSDATGDGVDIGNVEDRCNVKDVAVIIEVVGIIGVLIDVDGIITVVGVTDEPVDGDDMIVTVGVTGITADVAVITDVVVETRTEDGNSVVRIDDTVLSCKINDVDVVRYNVVTGETEDVTGKSVTEPSVLFIVVVSGNDMVSVDSDDIDTVSLGKKNVDEIVSKKSEDLITILLRK